MKSPKWLFLWGSMVGIGGFEKAGEGLRLGNWRRGWDSNPRYARTHNGFRDRPDRPLWHLSRGGRL